MARRTGLNPLTTRKIIMDSGFAILNIDATDPEQRRKLGAVQGGVTFELATEFRDMEVDGVPGAFMGGRRPVSTQASITLNLLEFDKDIAEIAIPGCTVGLSVEGKDENGVAITGETYREIKRVMEGAIPDFKLFDIAIVATYGKNKTPIIFGIKNAMTNSNFTMTMNDNAEAVINMTLTGMLDPNSLDAEPWFIRIPDYDSTAVSGTSAPIGIIPSGGSLPLKTADDLMTVQNVLNDLEAKPNVKK